MATSVVKLLTSRRVLKRLGIGARTLARSQVSGEVGQDGAPDDVAPARIAAARNFRGAKF